MEDEAATVNAPLELDNMKWAWSIEAEQSALGAILLDNAAYDQIAGLVSANDFFLGSHRAIFAAIEHLLQASRTADIVTVSERLEAEDRQRFEQEGGSSYIAQLAQNVPSALHVLAYARIVHERAVIRQLDIAARTIADTVRNTAGREVDVILDQAQSSIMAVGEREHDQTFRPLRDGLISAFEFIDHQYHRDNKNEPTGVPYGFIDLDSITSGMHPGQLVVIAARPSMGKSTLALNVCERAVKATGKWAFFFTLEMTLREQSLRVLGAGARINVQRLASGRVYDEEWARISNVMAELQELKIAFNEQGTLSSNELRAQARRAVRELGEPCLIVVDYLQLMVGGDTEANRAAQLSEITRGLKLLAKELQVPVMALSQLNRNLESRVNKRPVMSDLRDSGSIEQDADVILSIYRDEVYHQNSTDRGTAEIIINKQRNGPVGVVKLTFLADHTRFENYAEPLRG